MRWCEDVVASICSLCCPLVLGAYVDVAALLAVEFVELYTFARMLLGPS